MHTITYHLSDQLHATISNRISHFSQNNIMKRLWEKDPFVWRPNPQDHKELADRLGWLALPEEMMQYVDQLEKIAQEVKQQFNRVILLGMGGSSLAPEVFSKVYGNKEGYPSLSIIDSTHPEVISGFLNTLNLEKTIFVMASKSGGTSETNSFYFTFFDALEKLGLDAGKHFIALTDPGTSLEKLAASKAFAYTISTPPEVGGRYSALTPFGMLPAALMGIDIRRFLTNALAMQKSCSNYSTDEKNPGLYLGVLLGELALLNKNKITFITGPEVAIFPQWVEQLVAESTGKEGHGILPIADEPIAAAEHYRSDRVFVFLQMKNNILPALSALQEELIAASFPVISVDLEDVYDLAGEFYRWEMATAIASVVLGINPFDQPDVQLAKTLANESLRAYKESGALPVETPKVTDQNLRFFGDVQGNTTESIMKAFLSSFKDGDYICLQGFIPYDQATDNAIAALRQILLTKYAACSTFGYGPRFLHSTGQLHKGGPDEGLFIQLTDNINSDIPVSGQGYSFGTLITAQAQGDAKALLSRNRRLLKIQITGSIADAIQTISSTLS